MYSVVTCRRPRKHGSSGGHTGQVLGTMMMFVLIRIHLQQSFCIDCTMTVSLPGGCPRDGVPNAGAGGSPLLRGGDGAGGGGLGAIILVK